MNMPGQGKLMVLHNQASGKEIPAKVSTNMSFFMSPRL
jgi:hypothetical protein